MLALTGTASHTLYTALALLAASRYKRRQRRRPVSTTEALEPLSVLKPVHGEGASIEKNLLSFFQQDHPQFELLFSARDLSDPAIKLAQKLALRFPRVPTRVMATGEPEWPNARAYSVNALVRAATYNTLVITDSDVAVPPNFLRRVAIPLQDRSVGLVTCLYRGVSAGGLWTDLEALGMSVELMSNVLIAEMLNGMDFALGPATATRRESIEAIGGLAETGFYYADDFAFGNLMHRNGLRVVLSDEVVEHVVPRSSFLESFRHQVLWLKNNRFLRVPEHIGVGLTFAMPYSALGCALMMSAGKTAWAVIWMLFGTVNCALRSISVGWGVVRDPQALRKAWLYPFRDLIGFATWVTTWFGQTVTFRGERYVLNKGGKIRRL